tara:strand:- start:2570 stop:3358 length:789 start_codon:yes stop_codon:yes gene_type:complete
MEDHDLYNYQDFDLTDFDLPDFDFRDYYLSDYYFTNFHFEWDKINFYTIYSIYKKYANIFSLLFAGFTIYIAYIKLSKKEPLRTIYLDYYFDKGLEEYKNLKEREINDNDIKNIESTEIEELTPVGLVKMKYDLDINGFLYYSDQDIAYKYLEVVSRLLVNKLDLKIIYIDYVKELIKARDDFKDRNKNRNKNIKTNSVFAVSNNKKLSENSEIYIIPDRCNKYIKKGKLSTLQEEIKIKERSEKKNKDIKVMSFKDFKNKN